MKPKVELVNDEPAVVFPTGEYRVYGSMAEAERAVERKWNNIDWEGVLVSRRERLAQAIKDINEAFERREVDETNRN